MAVPEQIPYVGYLGNGTSTEFPITFDLHDQDYLVVTLNKEIPVVGAYSVDMNALKVVFATAPKQDDQIELYRDTQLSRDTNYKSYDNSFRPETVNWDFDTIWHVLQEQHMVDAELLARIKQEIEWRRTHDANFDELAKMRDAQIFGGLKQYLDTILVGANPNIFDGITAGIVFALDKKSVQTHLEDIYLQLAETRSSIETKANQTDVDQQFSTKANVVDVYPKTESFNRFEVNNLIFPKADKTYVDSVLTSFTNGAARFYPTLALANADIANIAINVKVEIGEEANAGTWYKATAGASSLTKSPYDLLGQAKKNTTDQLFAKFAASSNFMIDEYTQTGTAATGTGDLFAIQLKQRDVVVNDITLKIADYSGLTTFNCALYVVDSTMKVITVLNTYNLAVGTADIYKISGLNITVPNGLFLAIGLPSGIKLTHKTSGVTQTNGFYYATNIATVLNLAVGYTPTSFQNLNTAVPGVGIKATGTTLYDDYAQMHNKSYVNGTLEYNYMAQAISLSNATGEIWNLTKLFPTAKTVETLTVRLRSLTDPSKTSFKVRPYFIDATTSKIVSVGEVIDFTIQAGVTDYTANINMTVPANSYFNLGVEVGVNIGYTGNTSLGSFGYSSGLANALDFKVGYNAASKQVINGAVGFAITIKTQELFNPQNYVRVDSIPSAIQTNYLKGKKILAIGDSMVQGHSLSDAANQTWLAKLANRNGMTRVNYGINGTYLSNKLYGTADGAVVRYTAMDNDADYILVFAGTNDARNSTVVMGTDDSTDTTTFKGALNVLCNGLITKYPNKKIGFITPYLRDSNYPAYVDAIETICAKYGIPVFNNIKQGGVCWTNAAQLSAITLNDTYHLNESGMDYVSYKYEAFIRSL